MSPTLLLDQSTWDLALDASGNIAVAQAPYSQLQDAASYIRTFKGECWYNTTLGMPYFQSILGKPLDTAFLTAQAQAAAQQVPGVTKAAVVIAGVNGRNLTGQVSIASSTLVL